MDMENLGSEVSAKIRSAIKAKLVELNAYVDDELPDYIMVMIANKKTEEQMQEDLTLFLNEKALTFSQWLHSVLAKLQKVTFGGKNDPKKTKSLKKTKGGDNVKKKGKTKSNNDLESNKTKDIASSQKDGESRKKRTDIEQDNNLNRYEDRTNHDKKHAEGFKSGENEVAKKTGKRSPSQQSSKSFSVSKSRSPSTARKSDNRSPAFKDRNKSRSPIRRSPDNYRENRQDRSNPDYRRKPYEREAFRNQRPAPEPYNRSAPRSLSYRGDREKINSYDRQAPQYTSYQRNEPPYSRRSPRPGYYNTPGSARKDRNEQERRTKGNDYQARKTSPDQPGSKSPPDYTRKLSGSRSPSSRDRNRKRKLDITPQKERRHSDSASPTQTRNKLSSSIGAVISHESDGEYDPEKILKKSIVASKVSISSRPTRNIKDANPKIVRRAAMDAEMDIRKKKLNERKRDTELEDMRMNRSRLTKARRTDDVDQRKVGDMNQSNSQSSKSHVRPVRGGQDIIHSDRPERDHSRNARLDNRDKQSSDRKRNSIRENTDSKKHLIPENIKMRQAAMDEDNYKFNSTTERIQMKGRAITKTRLVHDLDSEDDMDSKSLEDGLPDLRQRLVNRKRRKNEIEISEHSHASRNQKETKGRLATQNLNSNRSKSKICASDEDEHQIKEALSYDKTGRKVLPKNLRIQATIRNDRHFQKKDIYEEESNEIGLEKMDRLSKLRKHKSNLEGSADRGNTGEETQHQTANKRRKVNSDSEDGDELSEMRKNAIESMKRRREGVNNDFNPRTESRSKEKLTSAQDNIRRQKRNEGRSVDEIKTPKTKRDSQIETLKQVILEIQDGDSEEDICSISTGEGSVSNVSEGSLVVLPNDKDKTAQHPRDDDDESEISLSSTEDEDIVGNARISVHTTNKSGHDQKNNTVVTRERKQGSDSKDPQFIVTLDGINSAYFKKEDKEVSKGGLKLKKQEQTSHTVYIKTNRDPSVTTQELTIHKDKPVISLPTGKIRDESHKSGNLYSTGNSTILEKPKAMVAPLRSTPSVIKPIQSDSSFRGSPALKSSFNKDTNSPSQGQLTSTANSSNPDQNELPKRKRILPPELSPSDSPHSVLAGANRHNRPSNEIKTPSPGIMSICKYWPNCSRGSKCVYYHPQGSSSGPSITTLNSGSRSDKFRWTSASALP